MSDTTKKLRELAEEERQIEQRIRDALKTQAAQPAAFHPADVRRDRRAAPGRTR